MKTCLTLIFTLSVAMLGGCAGLKHPQNGAEFRARVPESYIERIEIKRPYHSVANSIKKKAPKCLNIEVRKEGTEYNGPYAVRKRWTSKYNPTVRLSRTRMELDLQLDTIPRPKPDFQNTPPKGMYIMAVNVTPVNKNTTRLEIFGGTHQWKIIPRAVKNWATGRNMGCPDLASI